MRPPGRDARPYTGPGAYDTRGSPDPNAAWNFLAWPQFFNRVNRDVRARDAVGTPTRFLIVHAVLIWISLGLALVTLIVAIIALIDQ